MDINQIKKTHDNIQFLPEEIAVFKHRHLIFNRENIPVDYLPLGAVVPVVDFSGVEYGALALKNGEVYSLLDIEYTGVPLKWWEDWKDDIDLDKILKQIAEEKIRKEKWLLEATKRNSIRKEAENEKAEEFYRLVLSYLKWLKGKPKHRIYDQKLVDLIDTPPIEKHAIQIKWRGKRDDITINQSHIKEAKLYGFKSGDKPVKKSGDKPKPVKKSGDKPKPVKRIK